MSETSRSTVALPDLFRSYYSEFYEGLSGHVDLLVHKFYSIGLITGNTRDSTDPLNGTLKAVETALKTNTSQDARQLMADFLAVLNTLTATKGLAKKFRKEASQDGVPLPLPSERAMKVSHFTASTSCSDQSVPQAKSTPADFDDYEVSALPASQLNFPASRVITNSSSYVDVYTALLQAQQLQMGTVGARAAQCVHSDSATQMGSHVLSFPTHPEKSQQSYTTGRHPEELDTPGVKCDMQQEDSSFLWRRHTHSTAESASSHSHSDAYAVFHQKHRPFSAPVSDQKQPHEAKSYQETSQGSSESFVITPSSSRTPNIEVSALSLSSQSASQPHPTRKVVTDKKTKEGHTVTEAREASHHSAQWVSLEEYHRVCRERDEFGKCLSLQTPKLQRKTQEVEKLKADLAELQRKCSELRRLHKIDDEHIRQLREYINRTE